ncbi:putative NPFG-protein-coupled receptor, partial [Daphnia magna]
MKWISNSTLELRTGELDSSLFNLSFTTDGSNSTSDPAVELDMSVIERFRSNRRVNDLAFFCLVAAYCILIIFGTIGNSLVVYVVARQPAMRTARNVFVVNLAISDLLLCLITMPL